MSVKTLYELNQEFQTAQLTEHQGAAFWHVEGTKPQATGKRLKTEEAAPATHFRPVEPIQPIELYVPAKIFCPPPPEKSVELFTPIELLKPFGLMIPAAMEQLGSRDELVASESDGPEIVRLYEKKTKKQRNILRITSDTLFYLAILAILFFTVTYGAHNGVPRTLLGFSYFRVLSSSMQDEIPKDSFLLVRKTDADTLQIGDNITFVKDVNTVTTHQIAAVYENYNDSGARGFQTKGVNNVDPDEDIVYAANVVGKVIAVSPRAGAAISYLVTHMHIVFIIFGLFIILSFWLRGVFAGGKDWMDDKPQAMPGSERPLFSKPRRQNGAARFE